MKKYNFIIGTIAVAFFGSAIYGLNQQNKELQNELHQANQQIQQKTNMYAQQLNNINALNERQYDIIKNYQDVTNIKLTTITAILDAQDEMLNELQPLPEIQGGL